MPLTIIHTADWQLGKPFARVADTAKRNRLQDQRIATLRRIGDLARERRAAFVVIAGDLFDSNRVPETVISAGLAEIGAFGLPVYTIPGNHDHGGPGGIWDLPFFRRERDHRSPNLHVLLNREPVMAGEEAVILPCPLLRRHESANPCAWLAGLDFQGFDSRPRIVLAHGSTINFHGEADEEDEPTQPNLLDLDVLPPDQIDYVALGDWHGAARVSEKAWYSGTPETDRFPKTGQQPGHVACVTVARGAQPRVELLETGAIRWSAQTLTLAGDDAADHLDQALRTLAPAGRHRDMLVKLVLRGSLGLTSLTRVEAMLASWRNLLIDLRQVNDLTLTPTQAEVDVLVNRADATVVPQVASRLLELARRDGEDAEVARQAIALLHRFVHGH